MGNRPVGGLSVESVKPARAADQVRVDIQWMRALAVGMVLLYHLWPNRLPGGFVGVDVFLVISGFLITSHLVKQPPSQFHDVVAFWGRRIRRLLPAAFTVIVLTAVGVLLFAPNTVWRDNAMSAIWSGLYVENWNLAQTSVDYLASTNATTALQHYWSLSVEEQFYLVWPLLIWVAVIAARRRGSDYRRTTALAVGLVVLASLAWSAYFTHINPAKAYFVTPTRMWELGLGGALALAYPRLREAFAGFRALRLALVGAGIAMIVTAAFLFTGAGFPGLIALLPVGGAAIVIAAGPGEGKLSWDTVLGFRPIRFLGDISYSVYLWHWPLIVIVPWVLGHAMTWPVKLVIGIATVGLAWGSKVWIEDRFRGAHPLGVPLRRSFVFLITGMVVTSASGVGLLAASRLAEDAARPPAIPATARCAGAALRLDPSCSGLDPHGDGLFITPLQATNDRNIAYADGCWWEYAKPDAFPVCHYGSSDPNAPKVALFGNSHAGPYLNPLADLAHQQGWSLSTYLSSKCSPSGLPQVFSEPGATDGCTVFTRQAIEAMRDSGTKTVVMSVRSQSTDLEGVPADQQLAAMQAAYSSLFDQLTGYGMHVLVIRDVPFPPADVVDCLAQHLDDVSVCDGTRSDRLLPDPLFDAAVAYGNPAVSAIDMTEAMCDATTCWSVVGGVIVYFNQGHLTNTFVSTLWPYLQGSVITAMS